MQPIPARNCNNGLFLAGLFCLILGFTPPACAQSTTPQAWVPNGRQAISANSFHIPTPARLLSTSTATSFDTVFSPVIDSLRRRVAALRKPTGAAAAPLNISSVQTHLGLLIPAGDLSKRFGPAGQVGLEINRIVGGKWLFGGSFTHLFSHSVREQDIFSNISTESGNVITRDGVFEDYRLRLFGWLMTARVGRLIPLNPSRPNQGLSLELGVGALQHKIRIETPVLNSPQLSADYKRGYDRLSNGLCVSPSLGYLHYSANRRINYFVRLEGHIAQTRNRRTVNYDTGLPDHRLRRDALWGIRAGWILPLYRRAEKEVNFF